MATTYSSGDVCVFSTASLALEALLGTGAFGEVWRCRDVRTGETRAVKMVPPDKSKLAAEEARKHERAVEVAKPEYVPIFYFQEMGKVRAGHKSGPSRGPVIGIVMECIDGRTLANMLHQHGPAPEYPSLHVLNDIFSALGRLHRAGIVHNDVKPDNIMVNYSHGSCYLCDFGTSIFLEDYADGRSMPTSGTPIYMAPEMFQTIPIRYDTKFDIWSAGILGFELATGETPWHRVDGTVPLSEIIFRLLEDADGVDLSLVPHKGPYRRMLVWCLQGRPSRRLSVPEIFDNDDFGLKYLDQRDRDILRTGW